MRIKQRFQQPIMPLSSCKLDHGTPSMAMQDSDSVVQQSEVTVSEPGQPVEPTEPAEPVSSAEEDSSKTRAHKASKTKRKLCNPRKVVMPSDKETPREFAPKQRKSKRIRTSARAAETNTVKKSANSSAVQHDFGRMTRPSTKAKAVKKKLAAVKKSIIGKGKTEKRKARQPGEQNHEKDQESAENTIGVKEEADGECCSPTESQSSDEVGQKDSKRPLKKRKIIHKKRPCEVCGRCYNTFYLKVHMRKHTGEKPFACKECPCSFSTDSLLRTHVQRYHGNTDELHCDVCKKVFASKGSLKIHRQIHSDEKPYKCHLCDKEFKQPGVLNEHLKTHNNDFPFICEVCGKRFKSKRSVFRHKESTHDGVKNLYLCTSCGKIFHDKSSLWRHQKRHEQGYTKHICEVCGKQFHERKVLSTHMLIHENKKPYQCEVCSKQFRHYSVLKRHMCCHTGIKPFKCEACSRQFIHRVYMLRHKCLQKDNVKTGGADADPLPEQPQPLPLPDDVPVFVEQDPEDSTMQFEMKPKEVVVLVPGLLAPNAGSLSPLPVTSGQDPVLVPLPQHSEADQAELQMFLPLQTQELHAETVVIYESADGGVDIWTS